MSETVASKPSLIEFPAVIAVKAMGLAAADFASLVRSLVEPHVGALPADALSVKSSRGGKYCSVSVEFTATSQSQLEAIYADFNAESRILFTL